MGTVAGREGAPVRPPGADGPQPVEPLGGAGGFPALGWVVGAQAGVTWPLPFFTGNRIFGGEGGALVSAVAVDRVEGNVVTLRTDAGGPARMTVKGEPGGGARLEIEPPEGVAVTSTMVTVASPPGEGLYGLGARKDRFDQRGLLRNVWTEEQNASDERGDAIAGDTTVPNGGQAGRRCRFADARGRLSRPRSCHRTSYLPVRGARRWRLRLPRRLPAGRYQAWVRGVDAAGNVERKDRRRNFTRLRVRP